MLSRKTGGSTPGSTKRERLLAVIPVAAPTCRTFLAGICGTASLPRKAGRWLTLTSPAWSYGRFAHRALQMRSRWPMPSINGVDIHRFTASLMFKVKPQDQITDEERRQAKAVKFRRCLWQWPWWAGGLLPVPRSVDLLGRGRSISKSVDLFIPSDRTLAQQCP